MRPRIAVTGATGFIGRRFVERAVRAGYGVRLLCRRPEAIAADDVRAFDLAATEPLDPDLLAGCDAVVHLAAHIPTDHDDPAEAKTCWDVNALGTLRLVDAMRAAGVARLIQLVSANAYAPGQECPDEGAAMFPQTRVFYLASKVAQECYARHGCAAACISLATLRVASVYGSGQTGGAVSALAGRLLRGQPVRLERRGGFGADFVHVDDVCAALSIVVEGDAVGAFNVGSGVRTEIAALAAHLCALAGAPAALVVPDGEPAPHGFGFPALDIGRLSALRYRPTPLDDGLRETLNWMSSALRPAPVGVAANDRAVAR